MERLVAVDAETVVPGVHWVRASWVRETTQIDTAISTTPSQRPLSAGLAVTRRQTNGILCLIDDDREAAVRGSSGPRGRDQWSAVTHVGDRRVTMQHLCEFRVAKQSLNFLCSTWPTVFLYWPSRLVVSTCACITQSTSWWHYWRRWWRFSATVMHLLAPRSVIAKQQSVWYSNDPGFNCLLLCAQCSYRNHKSMIYPLDKTHPFLRTNDSSHRQYSLRLPPEGWSLIRLSWPGLLVWRQYTNLPWRRCYFVHERKAVTTNPWLLLS